MPGPGSAHAARPFAVPPDAEALGTITYEVTCQVSPRVTRVYDTY